MHDRRLDGRTYLFGNHGALYMNAMTWWDHQTMSVWSQPIGAAIVGPLKGAQLELLPSSLAPWKTWRAQHPDTLVLQVDAPLFASVGREAPRDNFVVGVSLGDAARAYYYRAVSRERVINDNIGERPVLVYADPKTRAIGVYLRALDSMTLTFESRGDDVVDRETGSHWNPANGLALEGPLAGTALRRLPYTSSFDWAWRDFYPQSTFYS